MSLDNHGAITLLRKVAQTEVAQSFGLEGAQEFKGGEVTEVAVVATDALFEVRRALGELEHLFIVVGFEDKDVGGFSLGLGYRGNMPQVGNPSHPPARIAVFPWASKGIPHGIGSIMRNGERLDLETKSFKERPCIEELPNGGDFLQLADATGGFAIGKDLEARMTGQQAGQAATVIPMLVGDKGGINLPGFYA